MVAIRVAVGFPTSFRRVVLVAQPLGTLPVAVALTLGIPTVVTVARLLGTLPVAVAVRTRETPTVAIA